MNQRNLPLAISPPQFYQTSSTFTLQEQTTLNGKLTGGKMKSILEWSSMCNPHNCFENDNLKQRTGSKMSGRFAFREKKKAFLLDTLYYITFKVNDRVVQKLLSWLSRLISHFNVLSGFSKFIWFFQFWCIFIFCSSCPVCLCYYHELGLHHLPK